MKAAQKQEMVQLFLLQHSVNRSHPKARLCQVALYANTAISMADLTENSLPCGQGSRQPPRPLGKVWGRRLLHAPGRGKASDGWDGAQAASPRNTAPTPHLPQLPCGDLKGLELWVPQ